MTPQLRQALEYAAKGWLVLPCHEPMRHGCSCRRGACSSPAKHPRVERGLHDATTDPAVITRWWARWPQANVGIRTGKCSDLVVVDIDPAHGGMDALRALECELGPLPTTTTVTTGSGGLHLYFAHPDIEVRNSAGKLGPGIDVRGDGGYVIAPPSRHASGGTYEMHASQVLASFPDSLRARLAPIEPARRDGCYAGPEVPAERATSWAESALHREARAVATAREGTRNDTLNRSAFALGQIVGGGYLPAERVESALVDAALHAGLTLGEARDTASRGIAAGSAHPRHPRATDPAPRSHQREHARVRRHAPEDAVSAIEWLAELAKPTCDPGIDAIGI